MKCNVVKACTAVQRCNGTCCAGLCGSVCTVDINVEVVYIYTNCLCMYKLPHNTSYISFIH